MWLRKFFNNENFPIYGITHFKSQLLISKYRIEPSHEGFNTPWEAYGSVIGRERSLRPINTARGFPRVQVG